MFIVCLEGRGIAAAAAVGGRVSRRWPLLRSIFGPRHLNPAKNHIESRAASSEKPG